MALPGTHFTAYISQTATHKQLVFKGLRSSLWAISSKMKPVFSAKKPPEIQNVCKILTPLERWVYYKGADLTVK